MTLSQYIITIN